jgi:hypothetical protein
MKSIALCTLIALALGLAVACSESEKTELRWRNQQSQTFEEIKWVSNESDDDVDQTWAGDFAENTTTQFKEVDLLRGQGIGASGGATYRLKNDYGQNFVLNEGNSETIIFDVAEQIL